MEKWTMKEVIDQLNHRLDRMEDRINKRFDITDHKLEGLNRFRFQILGGACVVTVMGSIALKLLLK